MTWEPSKGNEDPKKKLNLSVFAMFDEEWKVLEKCERTK